MKVPNPKQHGLVFIIRTPLDFKNVDCENVIYGSPYLRNICPSLLGRLAKVVSFRAKGSFLFMVLRTLAFALKVG